MIKIVSDSLYISLFVGQLMTVLFHLFLLLWKELAGACLMSNCSINETCKHRKYSEDGTFECVLSGKLPIFIFPNFMYYKRIIKKPFDLRILILHCKSVANAFIEKTFIIEDNKKLDSRS